MCAPRVQQGRAEELLRLNEAHRKAGGAVYLLTLTVPHDDGDALKALRSSVSKAWTACINGAPWRRWAERIGLVGMVRALEVTHGPAGFHPHLHVALYTGAAVPARALVELRRWMFARWCKALTKPTETEHTWRQPSKRHGCRLMAMESGKRAGAVYLAKMGLAQELVSQSTKKGRGGNRTPFQVLRDLTLDPSGRDRIIWRHYCLGIRGARQLTYSRGLLDRYGIRTVEDVELPDNQASLELGPGADAQDFERAIVTRDDWFTLSNDARGLEWKLYLLELAADPDIPGDHIAGSIVEMVRLAKGLPPPVVPRPLPEPLTLFPLDLYARRRDALAA